MPREGWISITVDEDIKQKWEESYELNRSILKMHGISSFGGFVNSLMAGIISDPELIIQACETGKKVLVEKLKVKKQ